jgi:hypothetical protein
MTGATDTVSMIIRNIVRQLETPDRLRGRMTGVNMVFFQGGPQLGEMEAGAVANWLGATVSVVSGGLGCLIATGWIAASTPPLRRYRRDSGVGIRDSWLSGNRDARIPANPPTPPKLQTRRLPTAESQTTTNPEARSPNPDA